MKNTNSCPQAPKHLGLTGNLTEVSTIEALKCIQLPAIFFVRHSNDLGNTGSV